MDESEEPKKPEFIYVDEPYDETKEGFAEQEYWSAIGQLQQAQFPIGLRILALIAALFMAAVGAFALAWMALWLAISLVTARQVESVNAQAARVVKFAGKCCVLFLGLSIAIFHPPLGIGLIILYFAFTGQEMNQTILRRFSFHSPHQN